MSNKENVLIINQNDDFLHTYEIEILSTVQGTFIPPLSFINTESTQTLVYNCSGLVPLSKTRILTLPKLFVILRMLTATLMKASDRLLAPSGFRQGAENIFLDVEAKQIKLIYSSANGKDDISISDYMKNITINLPELFPEILCIKDVAGEINTKIKTTAPSASNLMKIIGICERKWAQILP